MAHAVNLTIQQKALAGTSVGYAARTQRPFVARSRPVAAAAQAHNDVWMKTVGAVAAVHVAFMPFAGEALAASPLAPNPLEVLQSRTKNAADQAKSVANKAGTPDPVKDIQQKAKDASKQVSNPAKEYAARAEAQAKKATNNVKNVNKAFENPARDFARRSEQARKQAANALNLGTLGLSNLQQNVLFGFGEKKPEQAVGEVKNAAQGAAKEADKATPDGFSIFDADNVSDLRSKLKGNIDDYVKNKEDPAEQVVSVGKPGETQEENAERIRREAENGPVPGGDARAPTN